MTFDPDNTHCVSCGLRKVWKDAKEDYLGMAKLYLTLLPQATFTSHLKSQYNSIYSVATGNNATSTSEQRTTSNGQNVYSEIPLYNCCGLLKKIMPKILLLGQPKEIPGLTDPLFKEFDCTSNFCSAMGPLQWALASTVRVVFSSSGARIIVKGSEAGDSLQSEGAAI